MLFDEISHHISIFVWECMGYIMDFPGIFSWTIDGIPSCTLT